MHPSEAQLAQEVGLEVQLQAGMLLSAAQRVLVCLAQRCQVATPRSQTPLAEFPSALLLSAAMHPSAAHPDAQIAQLCQLQWRQGPCLSRPAGPAKIRARSVRQASQALALECPVQIPCALLLLGMPRREDKAPEALALMRLVEIQRVPLRQRIHQR